MPVDTKRVQELIDELGLEGADKDYFARVLTTNEKAGVAFTGQRERHDRFTQKTQELSQKEKELEQRANQRDLELAQQLNAAEDRIRKIMADYETSEISRTKAETLLRRVKEIYNLSDEDIPKLSEPPKPKDTPPLDIDKKFSEFKDTLLKELAPNFRALPRINVIQAEIFERHRELTGKRLTQREMEELMAESMKDNGPTLMEAWREKYKIADIEKKKEREEWSKEDRQKWEDEQKAKNSEEAMRQVRSTPDGRTQHLSPVFREYKRHEDGTFASQQAPDKDKNRPADRVPAVQNGQKLSGAERAAKSFIERRQAGVPLGKEAVGKT